MALADFLATASDDDNQALNEAQNHVVNNGKLISSDVMTMFIVQAGLYGQFHDISNDTSHSARGIVMALMDRIRTQAEFNFIAGHPKGDANLSMMDALIGMIPEKNAELTALKNALITEATEESRPFAGISLRDVLAVRQPGVESEVTYPSETYLISAANQGVDVTVELTEPAPDDVKFDVYLEICPDTKDQQVRENYIRASSSIGYLIIRKGQSKGFLALGSLKIRSYNKFFVKPAFDVNFTASVQNNRG